MHGHDVAARIRRSQGVAAALAGEGDSLDGAVLRGDLVCLQIGRLQLDDLGLAASVLERDGDGHLRAVKRIDGVEQSGLVARPVGEVHIVVPEAEAVAAQIGSFFAQHISVGVDGGAKPLIAFYGDQLVGVVAVFAVVAQRGLHEVVFGEPLAFPDLGRFVAERLGPAVGVARADELLIGVAVQLAPVDVGLDAGDVFAFDAEHAAAIEPLLFVTLL